MKLLLILVLALSSVAYGSGPQGSDAGSPKLQLEQPVTPHLDVPQNCQPTIEKDGSMLMTCECENCGQPESSDGLDPVPWACKSREGGLYCTYEIDTQTSGERKHSRI